MTREKVATMGANAASARRWGQPPWTIEFRAEERELPEEVDFAVVGGGFTGLAAAAWLRLLEPKKSVALFEASRVGAGSSGHTGGMALAGTASGDLPGLGDVLGGFSGILRELPGGTIDPGKMVSGLAKAARERGALIFEGAGVENLHHGEPAILEVRGKRVRAMRTAGDE